MRTCTPAFRPFAALASACALAVSLGAASAVWASESIKLGIVQPMTGPNKQYGDQIVAGAMTAIETINAAGGVKGRKIEPILIDDGCEPKQAVPAANQVIKSGAKFAVAHACSGTAVPAVNVYEEERIVGITPGATSPLVTDTIKPHFFFRTGGRDDQQGPFAARYMLTAIKPSKIAVLHDKQTYGFGVANEVHKTLKEQGANIVMFESINAGDNDYSAVITKLKAQGADMVYYGGYHAELGLLLRQAREQGLSAQFMAPDGAANPDLVAIAGHATDGLLVTMGADFTKRPENAQILAAFQKAGREPEGTFQLPAYAAVEVIAQSIAAVGDDPVKVADHMHSSRFDTAVGTVEYDAKGDLKTFEFAVYRWDAQGRRQQVR
ncbi:high-affinity branched-chain amino acid ABC transporter substrate-binding protein [Vandammella animalimorsus]|uniref:Leucine ABC transporter subunit substrate-binding protein LivK n=1 Tax=Vandammella animalimorsus TaxID=2029117 RepID=A0A2A2AAI6_9BURK|nr:high-affinity branched-chain amino acid ABC transporter substrate-binding protein [Vandammella animalimorsus]PAT34787.1 leucine ABC transporter subunit substrate-binding protein LivK [Vandammella animalimorsus]